MAKKLAGARWFEAMGRRAVSMRMTHFQIEELFPYHPLPAFAKAAMLRGRIYQSTSKQATQAAKESTQ